MVLKDSRIKMMNEVLNGIKVYTVWCMCVCWCVFIVDDCVIFDCYCRASGTFVQLCA